MASPMLESFCCMFSYKNSTGNETQDGTSRDTVILYNAVCIVSSALSICGAVYQLVPKQPTQRIRTERELQSVVRQNNIICWLTVADLLATVGILFRSSYWLHNQILKDVALMIDNNTTVEDVLFCAITSGWIQFFYISTYLWTFVFALDTYRLTVDKRSERFLYHAVCWVVTGVVCLAGLLPLYCPSALKCERNTGNLVPHYLSSYLPMLFTMIAVPILYSKASSAVQTQMYEGGSFTDHERQRVDLLKMRFRAITVTFYVCWLPNMVNGIFLTLLDKKYDAILTFVFLMAAVNPLQGFLNSLVYKGIGLCPTRYLTHDTDVVRVVTNDTESSTLLLDSTEASPLLRGRHVH